jgi:hypothetical protein
VINPEDLMRTIVCTVSWTFVSLRTPAAIRSADQRWIWLTVTAQSVVTLIDLRPVTRFIDAATGIPHAADLSKHLAALVFLAALLAFIVHVRASGASIPVWKRWMPFCLAGATALTMIVTFRPQPGLESSMICFDKVIAVLLGDMAGSGHQPVEHTRIGRCFVCRHRARVGAGAGPAMEPDRTLSRFGEVRGGVWAGLRGLFSVRSGSVSARL